MSTKKKVLVTGATGFVGANLVNRLVKENFEVHVIIRKDSNKWRLGDLEDLEEHRIDLLDFENLRSFWIEIAVFLPWMAVCLCLRLRRAWAIMSAGLLSLLTILYYGYMVEIRDGLIHFKNIL